MRAIAIMLKMNVKVRGLVHQAHVTGEWFVAVSVRVEDAAPDIYKRGPFETQVEAEEALESLLRATKVKLEEVNCDVDVQRAC
jgi:hypothetical protein